jgi:hypothetical protein
MSQENTICQKTNCLAEKTIGFRYCNLHDASYEYSSPDISYNIKKKKKKEINKINSFRKKCKSFFYKS